VKKRELNLKKNNYPERVRREGRPSHEEMVKKSVGGGYGIFRNGFDIKNSLLAEGEKDWETEEKQVRVSIDEVCAAKGKKRSEEHRHHKNQK